MRSLKPLRLVILAWGLLLVGCTTPMTTAAPSSTTRPVVAQTAPPVVFEGTEIVLGKGTVVRTKITPTGKLIPDTRIIYQCWSVRLYAVGVRCTDGTSQVTVDAPWTVVRPGETTIALTSLVLQTPVPTEWTEPTHVLGAGAVSTTRVENGKLDSLSLVEYRCAKIVLFSAGMRCIDGTGAVAINAPWTVRPLGVTTYKMANFWLGPSGATPPPVVGRAP